MLKDRVAIITGSARGIGRAIAEAMAREGADVVINDINLELAEETAKSIESAYGVRTMALQANIARSADAEEMVAATVARFGRIDILVNNAGITRDGLIMRMKEEDWDAVLTVNLKGSFNCIKAVSRQMFKQRSGRIINIASVIGLMGNVGQANYGASKAGLIGLTKTAAREMAARGITVNALAPGFIETEMTAVLPEDVRAKMLEQVPLSRMGSPEDVAGAALFLAGDTASYITGQVIPVDGGMVMY
ncbi:MAG: 3-oxoacyl-[acyl-carrier-protein] reductase [bacterium]|nr:3-oxoacyl-[acyl-carrier-protein] reductase [bacterium]